MKLKKGDLVKRVFGTEEFNKKIGMGIVLRRLDRNRNVWDVYWIREKKVMNIHEEHVVVLSRKDKDEA